jgi:hypothetical protein
VLLPLAVHTSLLLAVRAFVFCVTAAAATCCCLVTTNSSTLPFVKLQLLVLLLLLLLLWLGLLPVLFVAAVGPKCMLRTACVLRYGSYSCTVAASSCCASVAAGCCCCCCCCCSSQVLVDGVCSEGRQGCEGSEG